MTAQGIRDFIAQHMPSAAGLAALGAALDAHATGVPLDPRSPRPFRHCRDRETAPGPPDGCG